MRATRLQRAAVLAGSVAILAYTLAPFLWMAIASITPEARHDAGTWQSGRGIEYLPAAPTLQNYVSLFTNLPFAIYFRNSTIVATGTMILALVVGSLGAYGFVRFRFKGRGPLLVAILMAYMIPSVVLLVPLLVIFRTYGLINTYPGLILAEATNTAPFVLLLMINYFSTLPRELEDAALVDGCSRLRALRRIVFPVSLPGILTVVIFAFSLCFNEFIYAFTFTHSTAQRTLSAGVPNELIRGDVFFWQSLMAAVLIPSIPLALLYNAFLDRFIKGFTGGAFR